MPELEDPCAEAQALRDARRDIVLGESVVETRFGEDQVKFTKADLPALNALIADAERRCAESQGRPRRRYAKRIRFRSN